MLCMPILICNADRWQQSKDQKARDMQQASQTFSPEQPKTLHAFNPNAPEFVSSKVPKANNLQTQGSDINSQPLNLSRKAAQSKSSMPDTDSTASEPASPKIAAKMPVLNSQRPGNTQQTAAARPSSTKSAAAAAEPTSPAAEASQSATPRSDTDTSLNDHSTSAQTSEPSWLTLGKLLQKQDCNCMRLMCPAKSTLFVYAQMLSGRQKAHPAQDRRQNWKNSTCWGQISRPAGACR